MECFQTAICTIRLFRNLVFKSAGYFTRVSLLVRRNHGQTTDRSQRKPKLVRFYNPLHSKHLITPLIITNLRSKQ